MKLGPCLLPVQGKFTRRWYFLVRVELIETLGCVRQVLVVEMHGLQTWKIVGLEYRLLNLESCEKAVVVKKSALVKYLPKR